MRTGNKLFPRAAGLLLMTCCLGLAVLAQDKGKIKGQVIINDQPPTKKIKIHAQGDYELVIIKTDNNGQFEQDLKVGNWHLEVKQRGLTCKRAYVKVSTNASSSPDPTPMRATGQISGRRRRAERTDGIILAAYTVEEGPWQTPSTPSSPQAKPIPAKQARSDVKTTFHTGTVTDKDGHALGEADVKLYVETEGSNIPILRGRAHTNASGEYDLQVTEPPEGDYIIYVTHEGYEPSSLELSKGELPPPAIHLDKEGDETEGIDTASVEVVEPTRRNVFSPQIMEALPTPGFRSFDTFALLAPGVLPPPATYGTSGPGVSPGLGTAGSFSVNGLRSRENNFTIDGSDNNDEDIGTRRQGFIIPVPQPIESIQGYQVLTALADARYGRNIGGQINALTKTGGHGYHGTAYGLFSGDALNARDFFDSRVEDGPASFTLTRTDAVPVLLDGKPLTLPNPAGGESSFDRRQVGGVIGGRLMLTTDTFFFVSAEKQTLDAERETHFAVPTVRQRGVFDTGETGLRVASAAAFPASLPGSAIFSLYPFPNNPLGPYGANTYTEVLPDTGRGVRLAAKLDHTFRRNGEPRRGAWPRAIFSWPAYGDQLTGRYTLADERSTTPTTGGALFSSIRPKVRIQNVAFFYNRTLSPKMSDTIRLSFGRTRLFFREALDPSLTRSKFLPDTPFLLNAPLLLNVTVPSASGQAGPTSYVSAASAAGQAMLASLGMPGVRQTEEITGPLGQILLPGFSPVGVDVYNFPQERANNTFQLADTFTYNFEKHVMNFGFDVRKAHINSSLDRNFRPLVEFNGLRGTPGAQPLPLTAPGGAPIAQTLLSPTTLAAAGVPTSLFQSLAPIPNSSIGLRYTQVNLFLQDDYRATSYLRFTYGLRYELNTVPDTVGKRLESAFDPQELRALIQQVAPECGLNGRCGDLTAALTSAFPDNFKVSFGSDRNDFDGRVGFVFDPGRTGMFSIRGGFGSYSGQFPGAVLSQSRNAFPVNLPLNYANFSPRQGGQTLLFNLANPNLRQLDPNLAIIAPGTLSAIPNINPLSVLVSRLFNVTSLSPTALGLDPVLPQKSLKTPISLHYGITMEGQLFDYVLSVAYVGTRGLKLLRLSTPDLGLSRSRVDLNGAGSLNASAPFPFFNGAEFNPQPDIISGAFSIARTFFESRGSSSYNSLQGEIRKRYRHHFLLGTAFTYSHSFDDASDFYDTAGAFALPQSSVARSEKGPSNYDVRLRLASHFVIDVPWDLPFVKLKRALGGWQIAGIVTNQTGQPFTVNSAFDVNRDGNLTDRLNTTNGLIVTPVEDRRVKLRLQPGLDPASLLAAGRADGAVGRNTFRANGIGNVDLAINKNFSFSERFKLLFRTEIFNLFNRPQFAIPERILESPAFGASTRTFLPARMIQLGLKLSF